MGNKRELEDIKELYLIINKMGLTETLFLETYIRIQDNIGKSKDISKEIEKVLESIRNIKNKLDNILYQNANGEAKRHLLKGSSFYGGENSEIRDEIKKNIDKILEERYSDEIMKKEI